MNTPLPGYDVVCPIACGYCCSGLLVKSTGKVCGYHTPTGCRLSRVDMPSVCRACLCFVGYHVWAGNLTMEEGQAICEVEGQYDGSKMRGMFPTGKEVRWNDGGTIIMAKEGRGLDLVKTYKDMMRRRYKEQGDVFESIEEWRERRRREQEKKRGE